VYPQKVSNQAETGGFSSLLGHSANSWLVKEWIPPRAIWTRFVAAHQSRTTGCDHGRSMRAARRTGSMGTLDVRPSLRQVRGERSQGEGPGNPTAGPLTAFGKSACYEAIQRGRHNGNCGSLRRRFSTANRTGTSALEELSGCPGTLFSLARFYRPGSGLRR
jgi:hypothetical protein